MTHDPYRIMNPLPSPDVEISSIGYKIQDGRVVKESTVEGFTQEKLVHVVNRQVAQIIEKEYGYKPIWCPIDRVIGAHSFVFVSDGLPEADKVLLIIQGMAGCKMGEEGQRIGGIRAGVWDSEICINQDLEKGTVLPFLREAKKHGYGVIILNPNENVVEGIPVMGSESPVCHIEYVWEHLIRYPPADEREDHRARRCKPDAQINIIAHGCGAGAIVHWILRASSKERFKEGLGKPERYAIEMAEEARNRIRKIVFTDSSHPFSTFDTKVPELQAWLWNKERVINYVPSTAPVGTEVDEWETVDEVSGNKFTEKKENKQCWCFSAGVDDHASMNNALLSEVFKYLAAPCPEWDKWQKEFWLVDLVRQKEKFDADMEEVEKLRDRQKASLDKWDERRAQRHADSS